MSETDHREAQSAAVSQEADAQRLAVAEQERQQHENRRIQLANNIRRQMRVYMRLSVDQERGIYDDRERRRQGRPSRLGPDQKRELEQELRNIGMTLTRWFLNWEELGRGDG